MKTFISTQPCTQRVAQHPSANTHRLEHSWYHTALHKAGIKALHTAGITQIRHTAAHSTQHHKALHTAGIKRLAQSRHHKALHTAGITQIRHTAAHSTQHHKALHTAGIKRLAQSRHHKALHTAGITQIRHMAAHSTQHPVSHTAIHKAREHAAKAGTKAGSLTQSLQGAPSSQASHRGPLAKLRPERGPQCIRPRRPAPKGGQTHQAMKAKVQQPCHLNSRLQKVKKFEIRGEKKKIYMNA